MVVGVERAVATVLLPPSDGSVLLAILARFLLDRSRGR